MKKPKWESPCMLCGGRLPQAHRLYDAVLDRLLAGESIPSLASDYGMLAMDVDDILLAELKRRCQGQSVAAFWRERERKHEGEL